MKNPFRLFFFMICVCSLPCCAQLNTNGDAKEGDAKEIAYNKMIDARAAKIVAALGFTDSLKANRVKNIVADQYKNLNAIYTLRDSEVKSVKENSGLTKESINAQVQKAQDEANAKITQLHPKYLAALSKELTSVQIDKIKDGMTYDVVHVTYNGYNQMILNLTEAQRHQIMTWLLEAREYAMDAESSDKKHAWFGKYKGRINNYLSAAGYDLNREGKEWEKRRNEARDSAGSK